MNTTIKKLTTGEVREGKNFCIARIENGQLAEIEGRWTKGLFTLSLLHQPGYIETYQQYGIHGTETEWRMALALLYKQVANLAVESTPLPQDAMPNNERAQA
jgi:hypothetical protein